MLANSLSHDWCWTTIADCLVVIDVLREALEVIHDCAKGIMPIHKDLEVLRSTILTLNDARWTRLYDILAEAEAALALVTGGPDA